MRWFALFAALLLVIFSANVEAADKGDSAEMFWKVFREAVLRDDHDGVASMTKFPFEVRGPDDSQPLKRINKKGFPAVLTQVLSQQLSVVSGGNIIETTMLELIRNKPTLTKKDCQTPTTIRVHQFMFKNIGGHWLFTRAYLE